MSLVSQEIHAIRSEMEAIAMRGLDITVVEAFAFTRRLILVERLAETDEQELNVHRLGETSRAARSVIEQEAGNALADPLREKDGNVLHLDFGSKDNG